MWCLDTKLHAVMGTHRAPRKDVTGGRRKASPVPAACGHLSPGQSQGRGRHGVEVTLAPCALGVPGQAWTYSSSHRVKALFVGRGKKAAYNLDTLLWTPPRPSFPPLGLGAEPRGFHHPESPALEASLHSKPLWLCAPSALVRPHPSSASFI